MRKPLNPDIHRKILVKEFERMDKNPHTRGTIEHIKFADKTRTNLAQIIAGITSSNAQERALVKAFLLQQGNKTGRLERLGSKELLDKIDEEVYRFSLRVQFISMDEEKTEITAKILENFSRIIKAEKFLQEKKGK